MTACFSLHNVRFLDVLDIAALDIATGRVTAIVGKSGSGKSTLLRLLNKLISPTAGTITWHGQDLATIDPIQHRRRVVMLAQQPVIFDGTVRDNLLIGRRFAEMAPVDDDLLRRTLETVQLDQPLDTSTATFSGGEKQRLAFGRVLIMQPDTLLLDEPSSALDEGTEYAVISGTLAWAREHDITCIMVTHASEIAREFADQIIELEDGRVVTTETAS